MSDNEILFEQVEENDNRALYGAGILEKLRTLALKTMGDKAVDEEIIFFRCVWEVYDQKEGGENPSDVFGENMEVPSLHVEFHAPFVEEFDEVGLFRFSVSNDMFDRFSTHEVSIIAAIASVRGHVVSTLDETLS